MQLTINQLGGSMIGEITIVGSDSYLQVNDKGTIERLPRIRWTWRILLYIGTRTRKWTMISVN